MKLLPEIIAVIAILTFAEMMFEAADRKAYDWRMTTAFVRDFIFLLCITGLYGLLWWRDSGEMKSG